MARGREDERSLSAGSAPDPAVAPSFARRAGGAARIAVAAGLIVAVLGAACPGIENVPQQGAAPLDAREAPADEARLVRIAAGDGSGGRLVYDKDSGWVSAKCAELFPRVAVRAIPADYVETERGLVPASARARPPVWR